MESRKSEDGKLAEWGIIEIEAPQGGDAAKSYAYGLAWTPPGQGGLCAVYEDLRKGMTFQAWASRSTGKSALGVRHIMREIAPERFADVLGRAAPALGRLFGPTPQAPTGLLGDPRWIVAPAAAVANEAATVQVASAVGSTPAAVAALPAEVVVTAPAADVVAPTLADAIAAAEGASPQ